MTVTTIQIPAELLGRTISGFEPQKATAETCKAAINALALNMVGGAHRHINLEAITVEKPKRYKLDYSSFYKNDAVDSFLRGLYDRIDDADKVTLRGHVLQGFTLPQLAEATFALAKATDAVRHINGKADSATLCNEVEAAVAKTQGAPGRN